MDSLFYNKIAAAIIVGILLILVINTGIESVMHVHEGEKVAFPVQIAEAEVVEEVVEEVPSIAMLMVSASADKGARQFAKCKSCHSIDEGGRNGTGPNLYNIVNAPVAGRDGYGYSSALASHGGTWTYDMLDAWLANPKNAIPGNKMSFAGLRKPEQRADLIAYLRAQAGTPAPLPEAAEE